MTAERYRVGKSWKNQTIILEGTLPADDKGRRPDDRPIAFVDSAAPEGTAQRCVDALNGDRPDGWGACCTGRGRQLDALRAEREAGMTETAAALRRLLEAAGDDRGVRVVDAYVDRGFQAIRDPNARSGEPG